jgi:predicted nucleotidyltransferase
MNLPDSIKRVISQRLSEHVNPLKVILFGSYAEGTAGPDSDIDILVVKERVVSKHRECVVILGLLQDIPLPKDVIVASADEYEFYKEEPGSVLRTAHEKGISLYAR